MPLHKLFFIFPTIERASIPRMLLDRIIDVLLYIQKVMDKVFKLLGPLFVFLATSITTFIIYIHFTTVLPWYNGDVSQWGFYGYSQFFMSVLISSGIYFNYFAAVLTNSGDTPKTKLTEDEMDHLSSQDGTRGHTKFCRKCIIGDIFLTRFIIDFSFQV